MRPVSDRQAAEMRTRKLPSQAAAAAALFLAVACGSSVLLGPDAAQGIDGLVLLGPLCPVQTPTDPCPDRPYEASIEIESPGGSRITVVRSDAEGRFHVGLLPGTYHLVPESGDPFPIAAERDVVVKAGSYSDVVILFDTGIR